MRYFLALNILILIYPVISEEAFHQEELDKEEPFYEEMTENQSQITQPKLGDDPSNEIKSMIFFQYLVLGWITLFVIIIGVGGNIFTIKVLLHPNMKSPINTHFIGLAFSDLASLLTTLLVIPLRYILVSHRVLWYHEFHAIMFPHLYPITILFQFSSIFLTVAASICRCLTIYCSNTAQFIYKGKNSVRIVVSIFLIGFMLSTPYWFKYQTLKYFNPMTNRTEYHVVDTKIELFERIHVILTTSSYSIPLVILTVANILLVLVLLKSRKRKQSFGLAHLNELKTTFVLIMIIILFFLCNMPNFVMNILNITKLTSSNTLQMMKLHQWANFLLIINYSTNFAIYCLFGENFRKTAKLIFQSKKVGTHTEEEEGHSKKLRSTTRMPLNKMSSV